MELENKEQVQIGEQTETTEVVSTPEVKNELPEWKAPQTKEEFDKALKSAENKKATELLKSLGVVSVSQFKELQAKIEAERVNIETIIKERDESKKTASELSAKYEKLQTEAVLNELNVDEQYREDLIKLAKDRVDDKNTLSSVLKEMVDGRYKYAVTQSARVKLGTEKTQPAKVDEVDEYLKKFKGTPYYKEKKK